jgi:hypothetical protein
MSTIDDKIKNSITNKDDMSTGCDIDHITFYDSGPETRTPNCILRHTVFYYRDKAQNDKLNLDIRLLEDENNIFQLHTTPDMTEIGRGDEQSMKCLKNKLNSLEFLAEELKAMINERDALVKLFDDDFKKKTKTMMADLDNNYFFGECVVEERLKKKKIVSFNKISHKRLKMRRKFTG